MRTILHVDMNNFYASVECLYDPSLRGKPIAVAGDSQKRRGVVVAKSNEAKACGVKTGDLVWQARQKCPQLQIVPPHFSRYILYSERSRALYASYTDQVEPFSLDECWLDVTGSDYLYGSGKEIADEIRERVKKELGLTVSIGVSFNKVFAKLGSDLKKPDATTEIPYETFRQIVWPLPVGDLLYVGPSTAATLARYGIRTIGELAKASPQALRRLLGSSGEMLWAYANGRDQAPVGHLEDKRELQSVGNSTTTPHDVLKESEARVVLYTLCESVAKRLREKGLRGSTVQVSLRFASDMRTRVRQMPLQAPANDSQELFKAAFAMYRSLGGAGKAVNNFGVCVTHLLPADQEQLSFFADPLGNVRLEELETCLDGIRGRFGTQSVQRGVFLGAGELAQLRPRQTVPDPAEQA